MALQTIDRERLYKELFGSERVPAYGGTYFGREVYDHWTRELLGRFDIVVKSLEPREGKRRRMVQRVFVKCECGRYIPLGRWGQHRRSEKVGVA